MTVIAATDLLLLRHGATTANEARPYVLQGCGIDLPLSERGLRQADALAELLSVRPLAAVYASPLRRAVQTAERIAARHRLPLELHPELVEIDVGRWEGSNWDRIAREDPDLHRRFLAAPGETPYPDGESYRDVLRRVRPVLETLFARHAGACFAVVAHSVVNRALLADLLGLPLDRAREMSQENACVNLVRRRGPRTDVVMLNAHFHVAPEDV
jgi:broad specificity phosphatase PhoE